MSRGASAGLPAMGLKSRSERISWPGLISLRPSKSPKGELSARRRRLSRLPPAGKANVTRPASRLQAVTSDLLSEIATVRSAMQWRVWFIDGVLYSNNGAVAAEVHAYCEKILNKRLS